MVRNENIEIEELDQTEPEETLEDMFGRIEEIIGSLEDPDIAIEDAFVRYESGMKLLKNCNERIDRIEKKVLAVGGDGELHEL